MALFCRSCGAELPTSSGNWLGFKGGPQRLGLNSATLSGSGTLGISAPRIQLQLGDPCRSLLACDGRLCVLGQNGSLTIVEPQREAIVGRFQTRGPLTCDPCIDRGVLYVGSRGQLAAYSLGSTTMTSPHLRPLWEVAVAGSPVQALTPNGRRLYMTVVAGRERAVQVVDTRNPGPPQTLHSGTSVSWLAADTTSSRIVFLSEDGDGALLHTVDAIEGAHIAQPIALTRFSEHPIALNGSSAYGIFGDQQRLHRIDVDAATVDETLGADTQAFSISHADGQWHTDTIRIDSDGIVFSQNGRRDSFGHLDRVTRGSPLVVHGRAAVVAFQDGRILVYDLVHPPMYSIWRLQNHSEATITALASFGRFLAAGNERGSIEVVELEWMAKEI